MTIKISIQKTISFAIVYFVSFLGLLNYTNAFTNALGMGTTLDTLLLYAVLWVFALFIWLCTLKRAYFKIDVFFITLIFALLFLITLLFFPDNTKYILGSNYTFANHPMLVFFVYSFTGYIAIRCLDNYDDLLRYLTWFSYIIIAGSLTVFLWLRDTFAVQYMTLSYNMLLQVCFLLILPPPKNTWLNHIMIGIGICVIAFGGARGPLVGLIAAVVLNMFCFSNEPMTAKRIIKIGLLILTGIVVLLFYEPLLLITIKFLESMGIASRNLSLMLSSGIDFSSGRFLMYSKLIRNLKILGGGLYADRVILDGRYAHNLFLEWLAEFGLIAGLFVIIGFIVLLVLAFKRSDTFSKKLMLVLIPNGVIGLMFSSSYLAQQPAFFILLGLCANVLLQSKKDKVKYNDAS